jgi:hypothetical protein
VMLGDAVALGVRGGWGLMKSTFLFLPISADRLGILLKKGVAGFAAVVARAIGTTGFETNGGVWEV